MAFTKLSTEDSSLYGKTHSSVILGSLQEYVQLLMHK